MIGSRRPTSHYTYTIAPTTTAEDSTMFSFSTNATARAAQLTKGTVSERSHAEGMRADEPLIVMMDCLHKYAVAYKIRHEQNLCDDGFLGDLWLDAAKGVRGLLNGDGAVAMILGITTDSKDNGTVEGMFWDAMAVAGFEEKDL